MFVKRSFVLLKASKSTHLHSRLLVQLDTSVQVSLAKHKCHHSHIMLAYLGCFCASGVSRIHRQPEAPTAAGEEALLPAVRSPGVLTLQDSPLVAGHSHSLFLTHSLLHSFASFTSFIHSSPENTCVPMGPGVHSPSNSLYAMQWSLKMPMTV